MSGRRGPYNKESQTEAEATYTEITALDKVNATVPTVDGMITHEEWCKDVVKRINRDENRAARVKYSRGGASCLAVDDSPREVWEGIIR